MKLMLKNYGGSIPQHPEQVTECSYYGYFPSILNMLHIAGYLDHSYLIG